MTLFSTMHVDLEFGGQLVSVDLPLEHSRTTLTF